MRVFISFIRIGGALVFEYSFSEDSAVMAEFKSEYPTCETLEIFTDKEEFFSDDAYDLLIENGK